MYISTQLGIADDRVAVARIAREHGHVLLFLRRDTLQVALLQQRHAAARLARYQFVGNVIVRKHGQQVVTDARLVEIHVAGGVDRDLAGRTLAVLGLHLRRLLRVAAKLARCEVGQPRVLVDAERLFHQAARRVRVIHRVDRLRNDGNAGERAERVGVRQELVAQRYVSPLKGGSLRAQHQVRKIDVPLMRRHVGTFRHVAQIAQIALIDDGAKLLLVDFVRLACIRFVDEVEQCGKCAA